VHRPIQIVKQATYLAIMPSNNSVVFRLIGAVRIARLLNQLEFGVFPS